MLELVFDSRRNLWFLVHPNSRWEEIDASVAAEIQENPAAHNVNSIRTI